MTASAVGTGPSAPPLLEARDLVFRHHGAAAPLFQGLSIAIPQGTFAGIIGPNGSGKTTLLRLLAGLVRPGAGGVSLDGHPLDALAPRQRAQTLAVVLQESSLLFNFSVLETADRKSVV